MNMVYYPNKFMACLPWQTALVAFDGNFHPPPYPSLFINLLTTTMPLHTGCMTFKYAVLKRGRTDFGEYQLHHDVKRLKNPVTGE